MRISGCWLRGNCTDQKHCKPVRRVKSIKQFVLLIPVRRHYIVLQPEQTQGLLGVYRGLRDGIDDATINPLFHHEAKLISITFLCQLRAQSKVHRLPMLELPRPALFLAGKAFVRYCQSGSPKSNILGDFFIGAMERTR